MMIHFYSIDSRRSLLLVWFTVAFLASVQMSFAATLQVTTALDKDDGSADPDQPTGLSLREALTYSANGDTITFAPGLSGATIKLADGQIQVDKVLEIDGSALTQAVILEGSGSHRLLEVVAGGDLTIRSVILQNGRASGDFPGNIGGAIRAEGSLNLINCLLRNNQATFGGALSIGSGANVHLLNTTFYGNEVPGSGAGGAIINESEMLTIEHSTITNNQAPTGGGIWNGSGGNISLKNSIVAGNSASNTGPDVRSSGTITLSGANVISSLDDSGLSTESALIVADPHLAPIADYGGPTPSLPPLPGSPAIDAATSSTTATDQRGAPRPAGATRDSGAVEAHFYTVTTAEDGGNGSLREGLSAGEFTTAVKFDSILNGTTLILSEGELSSTRNLAISGYGLSKGLTVDANGASTNHRVFRINEPHTIFLENLTLRGGRTVGSNSNDDSGGGLLNQGNLIIYNCHIIANRSHNYGGGIEHQGNLLRVVDSTIEQNFAQKDGGGISGRSAARIEVLRTTLSGNEASGDGGGIGVFQTTIDLTSCSLIKNFSGSGGGGILIYSGGPHLVRNSTIAHNHSSVSGGGIYSILSSSLTVYNSTIAHNHTSVSGGGILSFGTLLTLEHCTIANNKSRGANSPARGGGISNNSPLTLLNTVIGNNQSTNVGALDIWEGDGSIITLEGVNCISEVGFDNSLTAGDRLIVADPLLGPLGDYGGLTLTMAPLPSSPLIDAGGTTELLIDQTGESRIKNGTADIGSVEYEADVILPYLLVVNSDGDGIPFGVKDALGLPPGIANAERYRLLNPRGLNGSGDIELSFTVNPSPVMPLEIILERSSTLRPEDFEEIYRYDPLNREKFNGIRETRLGEFIFLRDQTAPSEQVFYRLKIELDL